MSFLSGGSWTSEPGRGGSDQRLVEHRRATRDDRLGEATITCPACDAPVAIGPGRMTLDAALRCPFCGRGGPVRDFLSLARPTRPTRVVLRIGRGGAR
ncbi:MAG TPA: hypothetical protein VKV21_04340 [Solirubrobacteraceae bacterium]|nr:hypothetical protein [Solirubrobacteraceae bacterium]